MNTGVSLRSEFLNTELLSLHRKTWTCAALRYYPTNQPGSDKYFVARSKEEAVVDPDISAARPQERMG